MKTAVPLFATQLLAAALIAHAAEAPSSPTVKQPHVVAQLVADRQAIQPGTTGTVAVVLTIDRDWHVYWRYHGGASGLPTKIKVTGPPGWQVGPPQFPAPKSHVDEIGGRSFILDGTVAFLVEVSAPDDAEPGRPAAITAEVSWLVCKQECIKGDATLTLQWPVIAADGEVKPANESVFRAARRRLPVPVSEAKYLKIRTEPGTTAVRPGDRFEAKLILEIEKGYHVQSAKPVSEALIPTEVFVAPPRGLFVDGPRYPPGKERTDRLLGKLSEYTGKVEIVLPVEVDDDLPDVPPAISGVLRYQACDDRGTCFPPLNVAFNLPLGGSVGTSPSRAEAAEEDTDKRSRLSEPSLAEGEAWASDEPRGQKPAALSESEGGGYRGTAIDRLQQWFADRGVIGLFVLAVMGGFILNFMPCVLPVISIKVLSFVNQSGEHRWRIFVLGLTFAAGIIASFLALAVLIIALESQWGGLFQRPRVVISLAAVVTAFALSLFGVFSLNPPRVANELGGHVRSEGVLGTFAMGLLATVLGTACTAPFLSAVVAIATQQPIVVAVAIFAIAGFGMALPYILLAGNPGWLRFVPRPGPWMESFERIVGFALLATVVWLINPLGTQVGTNGLLWTLVFLLFVAAACWVFGKRDLTVPPSQRLRVYAGAAVLLVGGWWLCFRVAAPIDELVAAQIELRKVGGAAASTIDWKDGSRIPWIPYTRERAEKYVRSGHAVFIDYTADWCVNCKANERLVLETDAVRSVMRDLGVVPLKADYTVEDPEIKEDLRRFGRAGVPMYLVFPAGRLDDVRILPEILTTGIVIDALRAAGPSNRVESVQSEPRP